MRNLVVLAAIASASAAHADDDCRGSDAASERCSALWPMRDGTAPASVASGWTSQSFDPAGHTFTIKHVGYANEVGRFERDTLSPLRGHGFFVDPRFHAGPHVYFGVDLAAAWGDAPTATFALIDGETMAWDTAMLFAM